MPISINTADDAFLFDGAEPVTVRLPEDEVGFAAVGLRRPIALREIELSAGGYLPGDVRWHFAANSLAEAPLVDTLIVEAGGRKWIVLDVREAVFGTRTTCAARLFTGGS